MRPKKIKLSKSQKKIFLQRQDMDQLFLKFRLNNLEDWLQVPQNPKLTNNKKLQHFLTTTSNSQLTELLPSLYPNYPWPFISENSTINNKQQKTLVEKHREIINTLFNKFKLRTIEDWLNVPQSKIKENGGENVLLYYRNDMKPLLQTIYPFHTWDFDIFYHRQLIDFIFHKLELKNLEEWKSIHPHKILKIGGAKLLQTYNNDFKTLLTSLYPHYPWDFSLLKTSNRSEYFKSIDNQRGLMDQLYIKFNLTSLDDWLNILPYKIHQNGGELLLREYNDDMKSLLISIYPQHSWDFDHLKVNANKYFKSIENQRAFMDNLFKKLKLRSLNDWVKKVSLNIINKNGGTSLLKFYYQNDIRLLLTTIYPLHDWNFNKEEYTEFDLNSHDGQHQFMNYLFYKFNFTKMEDWLSINQNKIVKNGGEKLFAEYNDMKTLLACMYPYYPWYFNSLEMNPSGFFKSIENQRSFMSHLYQLLNLQSLDNWLFVSRIRMIRNGGERILLHYQNDVLSLLRRVYPDHPWSIHQLIKSNYYDKIIQIHRKFMDELFFTLNLQSIDEWLAISHNTFLKHGGELLLAYYDHNMISLLYTIYPYYPWQFKELKLYSPIYFKSIENQREYMNQLYVKFQLTSLDDWLNVLPYRITNNGGESLIEYYNNDMKSLLESIYPHHSWDFDNIKIYSNIYFKSIENQRTFMDKLFKQFKLKSLDDWVQISIYKIILNGGNSLLSYHYNNDYSLLLSSIYPHHKWNFQQMINTLRKSSHSMFAQRAFIDQLYKKFNFTSLSNWLNVSRYQISSNGGDVLLKFYSNDISSLFRSIYPNYPWNFEGKFKSRKYFKSIENQRKFMDDLTETFNFKTLDEWEFIPLDKLKAHGGDDLLDLYVNNKRTLLLTVYPNYPWKFHTAKWSSKLYFKSKANQYAYMELFFKHYKLKTFEDWIYIKRYKITAGRGESLLMHYYDNSFQLLLRTLYPNYPWNFKKMKLEKDSPFIMDAQHELMEDLFSSFNFTSLDDWLNILPYKIERNGGETLMSIYKGSLKHLLRTLYPNYPWNFNRLKICSFIYFKSKYNQQDFMDRLFKSMNFTSLDDWLLVSKEKINLLGGRSLLAVYKLDMKSMLTSIYPNYPWNFSSLSFTPFSISSKIQSKKLLKLKALQQKFNIKIMKDWYRIPSKYDQLNVYRALKSVYPEINWKKSYFVFRTKKTRQRIMFSFVCNIYSTFFIMENYHHPQLLKTANTNYEYDVYIPALNLAFEYQGEQHFNDLPAVFPGIDLFQHRDRRKEYLSEDLCIKIIYIPYWWDESISSLLSTLAMNTIPGLGEK